MLDDITASGYDDRAAESRKRCRKASRYESSSLEDAQVHVTTGQEVKVRCHPARGYFIHVHSNCFQYGWSLHLLRYTGKDFNRDDTPVGGESSVTVEAAVAGTDASATRSLR